MKNLVISGASRGIGKAIVQHFAKEGWNVLFCSRNPENLSKLEKELTTKFPNQFFKGIVCDVSKAEDINIFADTCKSHFSTIDVLINNAGVFIPGDIHSISNEDLDQMMRTNVYSAIQLTSLLLPSMNEAKKAHIFNMSSIAGLEAYPNGGAYNVTKHALTGFSKTLRNELKQKEIAVSTIYPGATLTDSWAGVDLPKERFMPAEDIAQSIWDIYQLSNRTVVEDIVLRPMLGDI